MNMVLFTDHLYKVAVPRINCICAPLNATSQDISSEDKMEKDLKAQSPDGGAEWKAVRQLGESKLQAT